jgi:hypothetical protein
MFRAHREFGEIWRRGLAAAALAVAASLALPSSASAAGVRFSAGHSFGGGFHGGGFRGSNFGVGFHGSNFGFRNAGFGFRYHGGSGYWRHYGGFYPSYFGGIYPYSTGLYLSYYPSFGSLYGSYPFYSSMYNPPQTVYVYPPPVVRYYGEPTPSTPAPEKGTATPPAAHPYDDPVAPSPEKGSLDEALTHIRTAWLREDTDLLTPHLPTGNVSLYHDGELRRELSSTEFLRLTREAVRETRTISFRFTEVRRPAADEASATAIHTYVEEGAGDRDSQTVTLRYELVRRDNVWQLRAIYVNPAPAAGEPKP